MRPHSAGVLLYRRRDELEVLLGHMGGPFWSRKHTGAWSIPKGELNEGEEAWAAARREFAEELGVPVPDGPAVSLGTVRQSRKVVAAWAIEGDLDPDTVTPGTFTMIWPPRSDRLQEFPEVDRVAWFGLDAAAEVIIAGQRDFLDRLRTLLTER